MAQMEEKESIDEVLAEVWRIKDELGAAVHHDIRRICEDARRKQAESGREIIRAPDEDSG